MRLLLALLISTQLSFAQNTELLPTLLILERTFEIQTDTLIGTCFTIKHNSKWYLVTAKHLFRKNLKKGDSVDYSILIDRLYKLKAPISLHEKEFVDIVVIPINVPDTINHINLLPISTDVTPIGRECYFLGYPLNRLGTIYKQRTLPFFKVGYYSASQVINGVEVLLIDAHNNPGFSGGPLISFRNSNDKINTQFLLGVVSGYRIQGNPHVFKNSQISQMHLEGVVRENSGILVAFPSNYILEIINSQN